MLAAFVASGFAVEASHANAPSGASGAGTTRTVDVELGEMYIKPANLTVAAGTHVIFKVANKGTLQHNFSFAGKTTPLIDGGGAATLDAGVVTAGGVAMCTVPGHAAAGMKMPVTVTGAAATAGSSGMAGMPGMGGAATGSGSTASTADAAIDPAAKPAADFTSRDPVLPPAPASTVHNVTLHATETVLEVAPGVKQLMWTFNDMVPGPTLRGHVGDTFNVKLINDGKMGHSIDFHASETSMDKNMATLKPGESLTYTFKASHAGIWMYHCGTQPALAHIGSGMYGAVVIDPPNLSTVTHEYAIVQSELYLGPPSKEGDYTKMLSGQYDATVFNGYYDQYLYDPIKVKAGDRVRVWVLDAGPNNISAFHVVGTQFDTVYKEGAYLLRPSPEQGGSQVLDLAPAQGGYVEFTVPEPGMYAMVSHKFNDVARGALGHFVATN
jgi:nitrite reductase (NO-forming)